MNKNVKRKILYCEICKRKINFFNPKQKRKDSRIVCTKCIKKVKKIDTENFSFSKLLLTIKDIEFKHKINREEKRFIWKKSISYHCHNKYEFPKDLENKVLKYSFASLTFIMDEKFRSKKNKYFTNLIIKENNSTIELYNNDTFIGTMYNGEMQDYLLKIIKRESYLLDFCFREMHNQYLRLAVGVYTDIDNKKRQEDYLLKTNIVKTQNTSKDKKIQDRIKELQKDDIVHLSYENHNKIFVLNQDDKKLGELPNYIIEFLVEHRDIMYIGVVDQVYRCANGLRTFDIQLLPVENGG
jgi:hypothetical protein